MLGAVMLLDTDVHAKHNPNYKSTQIDFMLNNKQTF